MQAARKFCPPASLALSAFAFVLAAAGRSTPVADDDLRKLDAEVMFHSGDADTLANRLDGAEKKAAALGELADALGTKLAGAEEELRESYMRSLQAMLAQFVPAAFNKAMESYRSAMTPDVRDYRRFSQEAKTSLELDEKKARELAEILVQERREQRDARTKLRQDRKKLDERLKEISRGVEQRLRKLLTPEEYKRYESWRKAGN